MAKATDGSGRPRVVHLTTALSPSGAGVFEAVRGIATHLADDGTVDLHVVGVAADGGDGPTLAREWPGVAVTCLGPGGLRGFESLRRYATTCDPTGISVVHAHGLWDGASFAGSILASRAKCPFIVAPHGMLAGWAVKHRSYKKVIPWLLWERRALVQADLLEAKSETEVDGFTARGLRNRFEVIPVGLDIPEFPSSSQPRHDTRTCLFLSRLHPVKGIDILLRSWAAVRPRHWQLTIAGPDANGYEAEMRRLALELQLGDGVHFVGPQIGDDKWRTLRAADLFVLPSHTENFGLVIAEALAVAIPCITTTGTPWGRLPELGLGWCVRADVPSFSHALREATSLSHSELRSKGEGGPRFVADTFSWQSVTHRTVAMYRSLTGW